MLYYRKNLRWNLCMNLLIDHIKTAAKKPIHADDMTVPTVITDETAVFVVGKVEDDFVR